MSFPPPPTDAPASEHRGHHSRGDRDRGHYQGTTDGRRHFTADAPRGDGQLHARPYGEMMRPSTSSRRDFSRDDRRDVARDDRRDFPRDDRRSEYRRGGELDTGSSGLEPSRHVTMHAAPGPGQNQHPEQPPPLPTIRIGGVLPGSIPPPPPLPPVQAPAYATTPTAPPALVPHGDAAAGADRRHERHARDREARRSSRDERGDRDRDGSRRKRSSRKTRSYSSSSVSTSSRSVSGSSRGSFSSDDSYARRREKRHRRDAKDKSRREKRDKYRSDRKHRSSRHRRSISSESSYTSDSASSVTSTSSYSSASDRRRSRRHRSSGKSSSRRTRESRTERTKAHDRTSRRDRSDAATIVDRGDGPAAPHQQPPRSVPHSADGADRRRVEQQAFRLDDAAPAVPPPHTAVVAASATAQQFVASSREDERREQRRREKEAERQQRELDKQRKRRQREAEEARRKKEKALRHKRRHAASFSGSDVSGDEDDDTAGDVSSSSISESDASSRSDVSEADYDLPPTAGGGSEAFWAGFGHGTEESAAAAGAPSAAAGVAAAAASAGHANDDEAFIPREPTEQELAAHSKMLTARLRLQPGEELPSAAELADVDDGTSLTIALQITRLRRADAVGPHATATEPDTPLTPYLIYHMLRNDGFPRKIVMMVPKSIAAPRIDDDPEGGAGLIDKEYQGYHLHSLRCLVEVDSVDSKRRLLYRFGRAATPNSPPGVVLRVSETTSFVVTAMPCPPGTKVYAHVNNPTTLVVTQACVHMLGPVWPRHFFRPRGATGIAETPHDGPFMQFKGPIRIALPSPGASSLPGNYTPRSAMLSPNDGMHGGSRMRRANDGMMLSAGGGGGGGGSHGTPRGLGPRVDPRDRPYPSPSMGASLASVGSVGRSPHLHSDSRGGLSSYDAAPMDGASSRPPRRHDYPSSDFDAPDGRRGEVRGRGFDRPDRPASQHHTSHRHHHQDGPHPPPQQQQQSPYGRFGGDDFPRHPERLPRGPDRRDYPGEGGLLIPTVRVGPRPVDAHGMPSSAASHPLSAHGGSVGGGDHFERPERYREGEAERFGRSHRSGAPVGHVGDRRRERSPASYRTGGAYPDRGHGGEGRDPDMHPTNHRGRGELPGAIGAREFHRGPRDAPMGRTRHDGGHERRHHYESGSSHGDMAAAHRLPSWSQQQHQQLQQHPLRSPIDAQLAPGDAQHHHPRPGTAHSREESTIRGEDIYSF